MSAEVIYIHGLAQLMGTTEGSIRGHIQRGNSDAIPPGFKMGRKWAWKRETVEKWLRKKNCKAEKALLKGDNDGEAK